MKVFEDFGLGINSKYYQPNAPLYMGIECEIESIQDHTKVNPELFNTTTDGSLRNNGFEYVSVPLPYDKLTGAFKNLHSSLVKGSDAFTHRTSIHTHVNCSNLDVAQVRSIILLYALYEEAFFMMVDSSRRDNIHCVALTETFLPMAYPLTLKNLWAKWHKYTALNIKPLSNYGTIEFRHMHGHDDPELLSQWVTLIHNLFAVGKDLHLDTQELTEDFLFTTYQRLFGQTKLANSWNDVRSKMDNQIIDIKLIG